MEEYQITRFENYEDDGAPETEPCPSTLKVAPDLEVDITPAPSNLSVHQYTSIIEALHQELSAAKSLLKRAQYHNENAKLHYDIEHFFKSCQD